MGYLLVILSQASAVVLNSSLKKYEGKVGNGLFQAMIFVLETNLLALPILFWITYFSKESFAITLKDSYLPILYAVFLITTNTLTMKVVEKGPLTVYMVYISMGMIIIPLLFGLIFLNETLGAVKIICIVLSIITCLIPFFGTKKEEKQKTKKGFYPICFIATVTNAMIIVLSKIKSVYNPDFSTSAYTLYSKVAVAIFTVIFVCFFIAKNSNKELLTTSLKGRSLLILTIGAIGGIGNLLFLNLSANLLAVSVQSMLSSAVGLVLTAVADLLVFKEKLSAKSIICLVISLITIVLFAFV